MNREKFRVSGGIHLETFSKSRLPDFMGLLWDFVFENTARGDLRN